MRHLILFVSICALSNFVLAKEPLQYICKLQDTERVIEINYIGDNAVPCTVKYTKDGATQSLWNYETTEGQCETKAAEFVEKQKSWGWNCFENTASTAQ